MDALIKSFTRILNAQTSNIQRYLNQDIDWEGRLIGVTGTRGTGKTTLLLQYIKDNFPKKESVLYASLDNIWFTKNRLLDLAEKFDAYGGTHLFLDEVHRYPTWAIELKNIYDSFPKMHIVFTGSSMLEIYRSNADLSRRAISYELKGLSFREFLMLENKIDFPVLTLKEILENHQTIASEITAQIKILPEFKKYLKYGYYPIFREGLKSYSLRLQNAVNIVLDNDLPSIENVEYTTIFKIKKLLMVLAALVPYTPNINTLSGEIETNRANTLRYLDYLKRAGLIQTFLYPKKSIKMLTKPDKIYLNNSNLLYTLADENANIGNVRETFFANQLSAKHTVNTSQQGDFLVDGAVFEVGGKTKRYNQIKDLPNSYLVIDETEVAYGNKIPLWLFGFLY
ncbi:MAG: AAA family ATPase [Dysgonamonadaceae bacterium]|jgi:predicted AAA+ superfamily ATPase|nr:AAA family ATPase [Dysgonamonadaceae bacterium]